jgi:hypothetical protein
MAVAAAVVVVDVAVAAETAATGIAAKINFLRPTTVLERAVVLLLY